MNSLQRATLWVIGCLILVFGLSISLAWFQFGHIDWIITGKMSLMLAPVLMAATMVMLWEDRS